MDNLSDNLSIALIGLAGSIFVAALTFAWNIISNNRSYKTSIKRLGKFEDVSLEAQIGDTSKGTLTEQHNRITEHIEAQIGDTSKGTLAEQHNRITEHITNMVGDTSKGTITHQLDGINETVAYLKTEQANNKTRLKKITKNQLNPQAITDQINALFQETYKQEKEIESFQNERRFLEMQIDQSERNKEQEKLRIKNEYEATLNTHSQKSNEQEQKIKTLEGKMLTLQHQIKELNAENEKLKALLSNENKQPDNVNQTDQSNEKEMDARRDFHNRGDFDR